VCQVGRQKHVVQRKINVAVRRIRFIDLGSIMEEDFLTKPVTSAFSSSSLIHGDIWVKMEVHLLLYIMAFMTGAT